jgi:hypothetical protein
MTANWATATALADLLIALSLIVSWMVRDARARGVSALPYVLLTLALGSAGPLVYLIRRLADEPSRSMRVAASAARG